MATATDAPLSAISCDPILLNAITNGVQSCLTMCNTEAKCVGMATVPSREPGSVTGMIGVHGDVSGFITVNMADEVAMAAVGGLLQEKFQSLSSEVVDGVGEITNIIAGGIKNGLSGSKWAFSRVTVPSVIVGQNYRIAYAGGLNFFSVMFEHQSEESLMLDDRLIQATVSLIRL